MTITVEKADPTSAAARPLLEALWAHHAALTPVEGQFWLGVDALCAPEISFFMAYDDGLPVGTAAYSTGHSELKSMFVAPNARGKGIAEALVQSIESLALSAGILRLETGPTHLSALKFYQKIGFRQCEPFGPYIGSETSVCMSKDLTHTGPKKGLI